MINDPVKDELSVLQYLNEGVATFDAAGTLVFANPAFGFLLGREVYTVGSSGRAIFQDRPELSKLLDDALAGLPTSVPQEVEDRLPDGKIRHLGVTTSFLGEDRANGIVILIQDVSVLKRTERELYQAAKMGALGRLAASVAHEVRNPLGAIDIQLHLLEDEAREIAGGFGEKTLRRLNIAKSEMKRLDRIVHNFLRFSRSPRLSLQPLSVNDVVEHVFELVTPEARERGVRLSLELDPDLPKVEGDEGQLAQAVLNIVVNGFQALEAEGRMEAVSSRDSENGDICLELRDTGCGIPESELDRIFEFYYTTKEEGSGLGLSIAQRIVYQHGGRIEVEPRNVGGTTFRIRLPSARSGDEDG